MIESGRLQLRPLTAAVAAALSSDRDAAAALLGAALPPAWPLDDLRDILPILASADGVPAGFGAWAIVERETSTVVGDAGFLGPPGEDGVVEIGYSVVPDRRRQGYASEAVGALVGWAFLQEGVVEVIARCDPGNLGSIGVLEAVAFQRTGAVDGLLTWSRRRAVGSISPADR